jgi:hypothetical protein
MTKEQFKNLKKGDMVLFQGERSLVSKAPYKSKITLALSIKLKHFEREFTLKDFQ